MIDFDYIKKNIDVDGYFKLALEYYKNLIKVNSELKEELPEGTDLESFIVYNKSVSILVEHKTIQSPSIEICLDLKLDKFPFSIGCYRLIIDKEDHFIDEFFVIY